MALYAVVPVSYTHLKMLLLLLSGVLLFQWGKIDAFAAAKEIKTVNIRVTSKLEAGSKLPDIKLEKMCIRDRYKAEASSKIESISSFMVFSPFFSIDVYKRQT